MNTSNDSRAVATDSFEDSSRKSNEQMSEGGADDDKAFWHSDLDIRIGSYSTEEFHPLRVRALESTEAARHRLGLRSSNRGRRPGDRAHGPRVQRAFRLLPETESPSPPQRPIPPPPRLCNTDKATAAGTTMNWLSRLPQDCLCAYSDRSGAAESRSAWGFAVYFGGTTTNLELSNSGPLVGAEVYDAEVHGAMAALEAIITNLGNRNISKIYFLLDNAEAEQALRTGKTTSSYWRVRRFRRWAKGLITPVRVKWIPGHEGIPGNEMADQLAREALDQISNTEDIGILTIASAGRKARALAKDLCTDWWISACPRRYEDLELQMRRKKPPELALPRAIYARLIAARTGHGDFASYHRRWNHDTAPLFCACGREKSVAHLVQCRRALNRWREVSGRRRAPLLQTLLGAHGWQKFAEYVRGSGIYEEIVLGMARVMATENS
ncbi:hypothetical protein K3495_g4203 [Podosphaera aphanis]|nr:hypothetical protein K3495_g4203 [Podosphaera aphanis]